MSFQHSTWFASLYIRRICSFDGAVIQTLMKYHTTMRRRLSTSTNHRLAFGRHDPACCQCLRSFQTLIPLPITTRGLQLGLVHGEVQLPGGHAGGDPQGADGDEVPSAQQVFARGV